MKQLTSLVVVFVLMCLQIISGQQEDVKVTCYVQYCEQNEATQEWECDSKESAQRECELNNVCMESQMPASELNIQQSCKFEGFLDDDDDAKIQKGETVCYEGYCYCKTNLCNNQNFKMPEKFSVKAPKA